MRRAALVPVWAFLCAASFVLHTVAGAAPQASPGSRGAQELHGQAPPIEIVAVPHELSGLPRDARALAVEPWRHDTAAPSTAVHEPGSCPVRTAAIDPRARSHPPSSSARGPSSDEPPH